MKATSCIAIGAAAVGLVAACDGGPQLVDTAAGGGGATAATSSHVASSGGAGGEPDCSGMAVSDDSDFSRAFTAFEKQLSDQGAPGGAIAILRDGELLGVGVTGSKRHDRCDPITEDTRFRVGGASSLVTALAALRAVDRGLLDLDEPLRSRVLPDLEADGEVDGITPRHLLTGTSMFRSASDIPNDTTTCGDLDDVYANAADAGVQAKPGTMQDGSDRSNAELVGLALERVHGKPFFDVVTDEVLMPLGMGDAYDIAIIQSGDYAFGSFKGPEGVLESIPFLAGCPNRYPSEGYYASIRDLAKLAGYLAGGAGDLLGPDTRAELARGQAVSFFSDCRSTLGLTRYSPTPDGTEDILYASASSWGFTVDIEILERRGLAVVMVVNKQEVKTVPIIDAVTEIYEPGAPTNWRVDYVPEARALDDARGIYVDDVGFAGAARRTLDIVPNDSADYPLLARLTPEGGDATETRLEPDHSKDGFHGANGIGVRLWRDERGEVSAAQLYGDLGPPFYRQLATIPPP